MTALSPVIADYIIELVERGRRIPIIPKNRNSQYFLFYDEDTKTPGIHNSVINNNVYMVKSVLRDNLLDGTYELGYTEALDSLGTEINEGDTVIIKSRDIVATVKRVIINPKEVYKLHTGKDEYKPFYKYDHVLKPVAELDCTNAKQLRENEYTGLKELQPLPESVKLDFINTENLLRIVTTNNKNT